MLIMLVRLRYWVIMIMSLSLLGLTGCTSGIDEYQKSQPTFALFDYFIGDTQAWGMIQNYKGQQVRRFDVKIKGELNDDQQLVLTEDFVFNDGEVQRRVWTITQHADGHYTGTANDVIGEAKGYEAGNVLHWQYVLALDVDGDTYHLNFDDWMYRQDDTRIFNVAKMKKWGITVGEVTLFFQKVIPE